MKNKNESLHIKLNIDEIIDYCKNTMGLSFSLMSEEDAKTFLQKNNYFFRLKQYAEVCTERTKSGKYLGLDFGHLVELSTIDMFLRKILLKMSIDFEHYLKVRLVNECQTNPADDGYEAVEKFLEQNPKIKEGLAGGANLAGYSKGSFAEYKEKPSVWNLVEMIGFNDLISFYKFYYDYFRLQSEYTKHFDSVRHIRNACAHNVCLLCNFSPIQNFRFDMETSFDLLKKNLGIGSGVITSCLKVPLLNDFAVLLGSYTKVITSKPVKQKTLAELNEFFEGRMLLHKEYFEGNVNIKNAYNFAHAVLKWHTEN